MVQVARTGASFLYDSPGANPTSSCPLPTTFSALSRSLSLVASLRLGSTTALLVGIKLIAVFDCHLHCPKEAVERSLLCLALGCFQALDKAVHTLLVEALALYQEFLQALKVRLLELKILYRCVNRLSS